MAAPSTAQLPQFCNEDGRLHAYDNDSNVSVWPYSALAGSTCKTQAAAPTRATTTVTGGPDVAGSGVVMTVWDGIHYFWNTNLAVTVPTQVYNILTVPGSNYVVT